MRTTCQGCGATLPPPKPHGHRRKWCSDRCRKASYDLECIDCGARVDGTTPGKMANRDEPRCVPCTVRRATIWTPQAILAAIHDFARGHGRPPAAAEWQTTNCDRNPNSSTVIKRFGSWNNAIATAGCLPLAVGHKYGDSDPWAGAA